jgi:quercetin dioxygenase-like cupin family protein
VSIPRVSVDIFGALRAVLILEGTLAFTINGKSTRAGAGSVMFAGPNDLHGILNLEDTHAKYFVFALGPENQ